MHVVESHIYSGILTAKAFGIIGLAPSSMIFSHLGKTWVCSSPVSDTR